MLKVVVTCDWPNIIQLSHGGAYSILKIIEKDGRKDEAMKILEEFLNNDDVENPDFPSVEELNEFIWVGLPDIMKLFE